MTASDAPAEKRCGRCGLTLPAARFNRRAAGGDRLQAWCRACMNRWQRDARAGARRSLGLPPVRRHARRNTHGEWRCGKCGRFRSAHWYGRFRDERGAPYVYCKECHAAMQANYRQRARAAQMRAIWAGGEPA